LRLALFDLDGTLLDGDTDEQWARLLADESLIPADGVDLFYERLRAGEVAADEFFSWHLGHLAALPRATAERLRGELLRRRLLGRISPAILDELEACRRRVDHTLLVTATSRFLAEPLSAHLGIEHLLATELEEVQGRFTGRLRGRACFRGGKLEHLDGWLRLRNRRWDEVTESWGFSDSINDRPMLERVHHAIAVDPDSELRSLALESGWKILSKHRPPPAARA